MKYIIPVIFLAACSPLPPHEPGCDWVYELEPECDSGHLIQCSSGVAVISCGDLTVTTNAPCEDDEGVDIDYSDCPETIWRVLLSDSDMIN